LRVRRERLPKRSILYDFLKYGHLSGTEQSHGFPSSLTQPYRALYIY
jgi:hypothetical protein